MNRLRVFSQSSHIRHEDSEMGKLDTLTTQTPQIRITSIRIELPKGTTLSSIEGITLSSIKIMQATGEHPNGVKLKPFA